MKRTRASVGIGMVVALMSVTPVAAKTFEVTSTGDGPLGPCNAKCTLRNAVRAANSNVGRDKIVLQAKTYELSRLPFNEDLAKGGDLDVSDSISIVGAGAKRTQIRGSFPNDPNRDGLITALSGFDPDLTLKGLALAHGHTYDTGGALLFESSGRLRVNQVRFVSNTSLYSAVENEGPDTVMRKVVFSRNTGTQCCAALYNNGIAAKIQLQDAVFDRNHSTSDTGAFYSSGAKAVLDRVTFSGNRAGGTGGGGMFAEGGITRFSNVTFSGNSTTGSGGGLYADTPVQLDNVTFFRNVADSDSNGFGDGGAMFLHSQGTVSNSIMAGNIDRGSEGDDVCLGGAGSVNSLGHNIFGAGGCPLVVAASDSVFGPGALHLGNLAPNGGFAPSHPLMGSSKALNQGSAKRPGSGGGACEKRDERGVKRPQAKRCDIGAYELVKK
jgi:CSLREA domain-containing protein